MTTTGELLREGRTDEVWEKYCGFLDLDLEQFMRIQKRLLLEQIQLLANCELGRHFLGNEKPTSIEEFRRVAPLTTYKDYLEYLPTKREDALPAKPLLWMETSGRTGIYGRKLVPCTRRFYEQIGRYLIATLILASAEFKGDVRISEGDVFLYAVAPPPYVSGTTIRAASAEFPLRFVPSISEAEALSFQARIERGFVQSIETNIDYFVGLASILLRIGEAFSNGSDGTLSRQALMKPAILFRLGRAFLKSRLQRRSLTPKDIWSPKGVVASGMDVQVYKERISSLWGINPLEAYACTEFGTLALQSYGARDKGLTLVPDSAFWEFIPEAEYRAWQRDPTYKVNPLLIDEVTYGRYVLAATSFAGGAFVRYIIGDLIRVISLKDEESDNELPQIVMESRVDDVIDLGSLVILTERDVWLGIGHLSLPTLDWVARKEYDANNAPILHIYIEAKGIDFENLADQLHMALVECVEDYATFHEMMQINPIKVSKLSAGTLNRYLEVKQQEGADLGHLKPPRMQPSEDVIAQLLRISADLAV